MARILLVEDEVELGETVRDWLLAESHQVEYRTSGSDAQKAIAAQDFDVLILDWMLPGVSGLTLCTEYRASGKGGGVIMLTARRALSEKEQAFECGADDYLTKPFQLRELSFRLKAVLRRLKPTRNERSQYGAFTLDRGSHTLLKQGVDIYLLPKEFAILELLMQRPGHVFTIEQIITHVWGLDADVVPETLRSNIKSIRKKIDNAEGKSCIVNVHGVGYKLEDSGDA